MLFGLKLFLYMKFQCLFHKHMNIFKLQSAIKIIRLIIPAAVKKKAINDLPPAGSSHAI